MKNILKILLLSILTYGCSGSEYQVEDELYNCLIQKYESNGIDITVFLDSLENHFIKNRILKDNSGASKLEFYKKLANGGELTIMEEYEITDSIARIKFAEQEIESCIKNKGFDSSTLNSSVYYRLKAEFKTVKEINLRNAAMCHVNVLTARDLEHPYFRAHMLSSYILLLERQGRFITK